MSKKQFRKFKRTLDRSDVIEILKSSRDFSDLDMSRIDLSDLDMSHCNFKNSRLDYSWSKRTKFDHSNIQNTTFRNSMLDHSSFFKVIGDDASFSGCHIKKSNFQNSKLCFSSFVRSTILETPFKGTDLYRANLAGALFQRCSLRNVNFKKVKGWRIWFVGSNFKDSSFNSAVLRGTAFDSCNLLNCDWEATDLRRGQLNNCLFNVHELKKADLKNANIMKSGKEIKVFISHASEDKPFARELSNNLKASGINIWLDEWKIKIGDSISDRINRALKQSDYMIVIISENFLRKNWPMRELNSAMMKQASINEKYLLPIKIDDFPMPELLIDIAYADFRNDFEGAFEQLLLSLFDENVSAEEYE